MADLQVTVDDITLEATWTDEPRAAAPVTVVARVTDTEPFADIDGGARVRLECPE